MSDQWMGSIAAQDQYRPLGNDPWTNTMLGTKPAPGQGFAPAEPVLYHTASPLVNITEGDIGRATDVAMGATAGGLKGQQIKAFHSSPHDFDKFDLAKIGTGEGAQVYGHGLYFAENPAVSGQGGQYWNQFKGRALGHDPAAHKAMEYLQSYGFDRQAAGEGIDKFLKHGVNKDNVRAVALHTEARDKLLKGEQVGPRTYEVEIKADPAHMLDWDKPLTKMSPEVQERLAKLQLEHPEMSGSDVYRAIQDEAAFKSGRVGSGSSPSAFKQFDVNASEALREAGIPGIKYLDQGSRLPRSITDLEAKIAKANEQLATWNRLPNDKMQPMMVQSFTDELADLSGQLAKAKATPQSSNYVIFDPSIIDIMKKYGIAGAAPAGMGALAAQDAYQAER